MPKFWHVPFRSVSFPSNVSSPMGEKPLRFSPFKGYLRLFSLLLVMPIVLSACAVEMPLIEGPKIPLSAMLDEPTDTDITQFVDTLTSALIERDYPQLQQMMANPFQIMWWHAGDVERPAAVALLTMRDSYFGAGSAIEFPTPDNLAVVLGSELALPQTTGTTDIVHALYVSGLGLAQNDEALIFIALDAANAPYWHSIVLADRGFQADSMAANRVPASLNTVAAGEQATAIVSTQSLVEDAPLNAGEANSIAHHFLLPLQNIAGDTIAAVPTLPKVQFADDSIYATVRGVIQPIQERTYLLNPYAAEELLFSLKSAMPTAGFTIIGVDDGQLYTEEEDDSQLWQGMLPPTQGYLVTVRSTVAQPFELTIAAIPNDVADDVAAIDNTAADGVASLDTP